MAGGAACVPCRRATVSGCLGLAVVPCQKDAWPRPTLVTGNEPGYSSRSELRSVRRRDPGLGSAGPPIAHAWLATLTGVFSGQL
jgi:hypothetical protein